MADDNDFADEYDVKLLTLVKHVWDSEVGWPEIKGWLDNFDGHAMDMQEEQRYARFALTKFMYFGKRLIREMLKSLYRDHFESPLLQQIRKSHGGTKDVDKLRNLYNQELRATRFIGVGNPAESGAHLLYFFRQVNHLGKDLFVDFFGAFLPEVDSDFGRPRYIAQEKGISRYVFFDDFVGSATQVSTYLSKHLEIIRNGNENIELCFMSLFATEDGIEKLNAPNLFNGKAKCLFTLDESYKAFGTAPRYFAKPPEWFDIHNFKKMVQFYGEKLQPHMPLGYKNGQYLIGFSHNTPDNVPPIFWDEGSKIPWSPIFIRFDKNYGGV